ncbi:hypothetical protein HYH03_016459 [Edaphochlamys debaryana]|uniref:Uncharacterized protein n=1 Tax=Edaphochlamys debaryana TaxID=47281 RepID=A0A835XKE5_9CHLO|nr:hypothetical protein HYH03_016459 [Edaphochlamys debaryana]|eukprot:KAG2484807.1 hypothetical protein HYH03_016459 [Edaphochlamys debaryana]
MDGFKSFDWSNDTRWKDYLKTVELPAGDSEAMMTKVKARFYKKVIDPSFDPTLVTGSAAKASSSFMSGGVPPSGGGGSGRDTGASGGTGADGGGGYASYASRGPPPPPPPRYGQYGGAGSGQYGSASMQHRLFFMHVAMLVLGLYSILPFVPYGRLSYLWFLRLAMLTSALKLYTQFGLPSFRPWSAAMAWLQRAMPTADFMSALTALSFSSLPPNALVAGPLLVLAAYHAAAWLAAHASGNPLWQKYGARIHTVMLRKQDDALFANAAMEIGALGLLVLQLITPARSLLTLIFLTQILKLKLHMPDTARHHRAVWGIVDQKTLPLRLRFPLIETVVQMGVRWMNSVPGAPPP